MKNENAQANRVKIQDFKGECLRQMEANGLGCRDPIVATGKFYRYSVDANRSKLDEWYIAFEGISDRGNPYLTCIYGSWSTGETYEFKSWNQESLLSQADIEEFKKLSVEKSQQAELQLKEQHDEAATNAKIFWQKSLETPPSEDYLSYPKMKGIDIFGVKFDKNPNGYPSMIIPFQNIDEQVRTLQFISVGADGKSYKTWLAGGEKKGNFHTIGKISDGCPIYVVEGYATGASVHMATKKCVVVAGDKGNLLPVVENVRKKYPTLPITIAGDSDSNGGGQEKANEVARAFGCNVVLPLFPQEKSAGADGVIYTDFNDLHKAFGLDEVIKQLASATPREIIQDELKDVAKSILKEEKAQTFFDLSSLPEILRNYVQSICKTTNADPIIITSSVLVTVSAFMRKSFFLPENEAYFQNLYPNLWILSIAGSGQFKTTALEKGAKFIYENASQVEEIIKKINVELQVISESDGEKRRSLELERFEISKRNILLPNKTTTEALLEHLSFGHDGAILQSEFAEWLQGFEKNGNNDLKSIFTVLYDVPKSYRYKTKTQGDHCLSEPFISICAVSTFEWLKRNLKPDDTASGFFARFLIFTPQYDDSEIPPALPSRKIEQISPAEVAFKKRLDEICRITNQTAKRRYKISESARKVYEDMYANIYKTVGALDDKYKEILFPYVKRWSPYLLKLAMIMQVFENVSSEEISDKAVIAGMVVLDPAIKSTIQLFISELGESKHQQECRKVLGWICKKTQASGASVKRKDLIRSHQLAGGAKEYDYVINTLEESGLVEVVRAARAMDYCYLPKKDN